jgi:hypothetical protein
MEVGSAAATHVAVFLKMRERGSTSEAKIWGGRPADGTLQPGGGRPSARLGAPAGPPPCAGGAVRGARAEEWRRRLRPTWGSGRRSGAAAWAVWPPRRRLGLEGEARGPGTAGWGRGGRGVGWARQSGARQARAAAGKRSAGARNWGRAQRGPPSGQKQCRMGRPHAALGMTPAPRPSAHHLHGPHAGPGASPVSAPPQRKRCVSSLNACSAARPRVVIWGAQARGGSRRKVGGGKAQAAEQGPPAVEPPARLLQLAKLVRGPPRPLGCQPRPRPQGPPSVAPLAPLALPPASPHPAAVEVELL